MGLWWNLGVRENDGRKIDHATLEQMRIRAVRQMQDGAHPEDVAAALGLRRSTVYGWLAKFRRGGVEALRAKPVPGRPRKLSAGQLSELYRLIVGSDPRQLQFEFALWTREMVRELIRRQFGVALSVVSVGRVLRLLGLSPQRPLWRAYQQDPAAVARWKSEVFPAIRAAAAQRGATIHFVDEAGVRSDYHAGTTWAPVGVTPVVASTGARHAVHLISAVTAKGALRFSTFSGSFTGATFVDFLTKLLAGAPGPVFVVVDGHPAHRATVVKEYVQSTNGRLQLHFLPGYSPELNPDEWVWKNIKADRVGRAGVTSLHEFHARVESALHRLQKLPHLIRGFFADSNLRYITA